MSAFQKERHKTVAVLLFPFKTMQDIPGKARFWRLQPFLYCSFLMGRHLF